VNLAANLTASAEVFAGKTALRLDDCSFSYRAVDAASARVAGLLRQRGIGPGDRVGLMLPNVPEFAVVYYGILRIGAVAVLISALLEQHDVTFLLADSGAGLLFAWHGLAEEAEAGARAPGSDCLFVTPREFDRLLSVAEPLRDVCEREAKDVAVIGYADAREREDYGHADLAGRVSSAIELHSLAEDDVVLAALPLDQEFGHICSLNAVIASGATLSLVNRFDAGRALDAIERDRVTVFHGTSSMYRALLDHPRRESFDISTLRQSVTTAVVQAVDSGAGVRAAQGPRAGRLPLPAPPFRELRRQGAPMRPQRRGR
jgi:long-chain acyl-CoA synthetase